MKKQFIVWVLLGLSCIAYSQTITIKDAETGEPLELVTLMSENPKAFTTTNAQGQADISAFQKSVKIEIRALGYKTETKRYEDLLSLSMELHMVPTNIGLDAVVVSATRWNQRSNDIPSKIITISPKEMALQNPQTAADLLSFSGKVFIQKSQQGGGSPMIRGFATNRLLYTVDGVRMNTAIFRGGNLQNVISLDPFSVKNTEVFFGPGSVIYSSDAIGGVMSFETLTPQLTLIDKPLITGRAVTRFSTANNEKTGHLDINVGWKKWAMVTSITATDYDDLRMGSHGPDEYLRPFYVQRIDSLDVVVTNDDPKVQVPSGYSQVNIMQKVRFKPGEKLNLEYGFHYSETSDYSRYDRHMRLRDGLPRYGEWYYGPQKWMMNNLHITQTGNNTFYDQVTLRLAHQFFEESRISRTINKPDREIRIEKVNAFSGNFDFLKSLGSRNKLFFGIEVVVDDVKSKGINKDISTGISAPGATRYPQSTWASYGAYITDQLKVTEKLLLQAGIRYNYFQIEADFDTTFYPFPFTSATLKNGALAGSIGFVYRPSGKWVINTNLATAFRSPNVDDIGKVFDSEPGSVTVPNPDLKPEYAYNLDLGMTRVFGDAVKVDLTLFYTILRNALVRRDYLLNGMDSIMYDGTLSRVQAIQNAAVAHVYGIQAGMEIKLPKGFGFSTDFNYQAGEEELDDGSTSPSRHAPPWFGVSRLIYAANKLNLQLYVTYSGERKFKDMPEEEKGKTEIYATDGNGNPYSPSWYTLNFKATYPFAEHFTISAGMENITDQRYRPYSSGIASPGRNFLLSLRAHF